MGKEPPHLLAIFKGRMVVYQVWLLARGAWEDPRLRRGGHQEMEKEAWGRGRGCPGVKRILHGQECVRPVPHVELAVETTTPQEPVCNRNAQRGQVWFLSTPPPPTPSPLHDKDTTVSLSQGHQCLPTQWSRQWRSFKKSAVSRAPRSLQLSARCWGWGRPVFLLPVLLGEWRTARGTMWFNEEWKYNNLGQAGELEPEPEVGFGGSLDMRVRVEALGRGKMRAQRRGSMTQIREKPS